MANFHEDIELGSTKPHETIYCTPDEKPKQYVLDAKAEVPFL